MNKTSADGWDYSPLSIPVIKERRAYQVGYRLFKTPKAAAKSIAWHFILSKYGDPKKVTLLHGMQCDCHEEDTHPSGYSLDEPYIDASQCYLHSRYDGYFKRLHSRLTRRILKEWGMG
jgi:hypothetical protein